MVASILKTFEKYFLAAYIPSIVNLTLRQPYHA